ncbi:MAG TPA: 4-(cytidine 5'-diphospho)-2-C-methyl-D-erythritol kinase, partial [Candidatus Tumulicola sp.]|nr:4-(cytidine 5'-diphospho)-2-C-methyl-D-erythritol kinase [Candidatus Tumulicola sp.]
MVAVPFASQVAQAPSAPAWKRTPPMGPAYLAPAKINLTLEVLARRVDGYHGLRSVMVPLDFGDEIVVEPSAAFEFACDRRELENDDNLAVRALRALGPLPPYRVSLRKRIPSEAGLGGGSSDAAAILRAAMEGAFGTPSQRDWIATARALGSDVPFFLAGTGALVEGTGERVTPLGALPRWHALIVTPPVSVSTALAYARLDERPPAVRPRRGSASLSALAALQRGEFEAVESLLHNDFEPVVAGRSPEIATALSALRAAGARRPQLSGSGSSVFALAPTRDRLEGLLK